MPEDPQKLNSTNLYIYRLTINEYISQAKHYYTVLHLCWTYNETMQRLIKDLFSSILLNYSTIMARLSLFSAYFVLTLIPCIQPKNKIDLNHGKLCLCEGSLFQVLRDSHKIYKICYGPQPIATGMKSSEWDLRGIFGHFRQIWSPKSFILLLWSP